MWLHVITAYFLISVLLTEWILRDGIGTQEFFTERAGYYLGGILFGPIAVVCGAISGIRKAWDERGKW